MLAIAKGIADGLVAQLGKLVRAVVPNGSDWCVQCDDGQLDARHVVKTVPAPQVAGNLGAQHPLVAQIADVEMSPGLTLMAAPPGDVSGDAPTARRGEQNDPLALITHDSSKPDRPRNGGSAWLSQAGLAFNCANARSHAVLWR
jgi:renalase